SIGLRRFITPDAERAGVRMPRGAFGTEEPLCDGPPGSGKLCGAESDDSPVSIVEKHVVISKRVAIVGGPALAPASRRSFQRMSLENPVANVDHVNVLLHDDVARKNAVVHPVAQAMLGRGGVRHCPPGDVAGKIVSFSADNLTER